METNRECLVCGQALPPGELRVVPSSDIEDAWSVECRMCGISIVTDEARVEIASLGKTARAELGAWVRERSVRERKPPVICSTAYAGTEDASTYRVGGILDSRVPTSIQERLDRILLNLAALSKEPGERCSVDGRDIYIAFARTVRQMHFYLDALSEQGLLSKVADGWESMQITPGGWNRIASLQARKARPDQAFVAMSFAEELEAAWRDGIQIGIAACGYKALRVDKEEHNEKICDRLIAEIRRSSFLVADVTLHKQGVYFEAGYALALGLPVIWSCRKDDLSACHFDTRQYSHVVWESPEQLAKALENRIRATIGDLTS